MVLEGAHRSHGLVVKPGDGTLHPRVERILYVPLRKPGIAVTLTLSNLRHPMLEVCTAAEDDVARFLLDHDLQVGKYNPSAFVVAPCIRRGPAQACVVAVFMRLDGEVDNGRQPGVNTSGSLIEMTSLQSLASSLVWQIVKFFLPPGYGYWPDLDLG